LLAAAPFAKVLVSSHVGDAIIHLTHGLSLSAIAIGWLKIKEVFPFI
jgi:hypothetical protein